MDPNTQKLIRLADTFSMREMDRHAIEDLGISGAVLMENAARSVADWVEENKLKKSLILLFVSIIFFEKSVYKLYPSFTL